jgi:hypothetical protein
VTLKAGSTLGPYRIVEAIGAGGMGEVYRARDPRLQRDVAIKVLSEDAAGDADRASRFEREARAVSGVNHPNIATVYDVGQEGSIRYIAMELVEGRSLRDEMTRPLPLRRVTALAAGVAQGLARAHHAGIVHRDLKPDNVMLSADGVPKIVDFGLAKSVGANAGDLSTATGTLPGSLLGTVAYMSPEQASGGAADFRSDQFSFGTMLYELAAGQHPFRRDTPAQTLAAIIEDDPAPLATIAPKVALPLRWIIERCLAKAPADRYGSTDDLARDLARVRDHVSDLSSGAAAPAAATPRRVWAMAVPVAAVVAAGAAWLAFATPVSSDVATPPKWLPITFHQGAVQTARFVGDGETIVYAAAWDGRPIEVYSTTRSGPESRRLELPPAGLMAVSRGGEIAVSLECTYEGATGLCPGTLGRVPLLGGAPRQVAAGVRAADWGPGGELAVVRQSAGGMFVEFPQGTVVSGPDAAHVRFSRDGARLAWTERGEVLVRDGNEVRAVSSGWEFLTGMAWSAAGEALFVSGVRTPDCVQCVMRVAADQPDRVVLRGAGRLRVLDVGVNGDLLVDSSTSSNPMVSWIGAARPPAPITWFDGSIPDALSRDGSTVLFTERGTVSIGRTDLYPIYVRSAAGGPATRIGTGYGLDLSPDGRWALTRTRPGPGLPAQLVLLPLGPGAPRFLDAAGLLIDVVSGWFIDDQRIIFPSRAGDGPSRTYVQSIESGPPALVSHEAGAISSPVSPDGTRFVSRRDDGSYWLASLAGVPSRRLGFQPAAREPIVGWSADGAALLVGSVENDDVVVDRVDIERGTRSPFRRERSPSRGMNPSRTRISRDGSVLIAGGSERVSAVYLVTGVR